MKFQTEDEARAWVQFFAATMPSEYNRRLPGMIQSAAVEDTVKIAEQMADAALEAYRKRCQRSRGSEGPFR